MKLKKQMDSIYRKLTLDKIPWNIESPPDILVDLVESQWVKPCEVIDLGCGAGNYAVWLASRGFRITGLDISKNALALAKKLAENNGVSCRLVMEDLTGVVNEYDCSFDFAYDWEVLHHVFPDDRAQYIGNVHRMLRPGGKYLSVCFSEKEPPSFGGEGKYRKTPLGTTLYFSSEQELLTLLEPLFNIEELCTIEISGKNGPHMAVKALMSKRDA